MAKVSLRSYNREIEVMVGEGHFEEAVGHCNHILKTYPKHLETYQLLGKAYLEAKRYQDASDVFLRLLTATPNNFLAHVAMSMIYEATEKLDDAIWHMERAFETQPSNAAVQNELQRLYGNRDGLKPPKIRMTRGALANVYIQGELYPQAIAEIHSIEARDPGRADIQELLALAYFRSGQRVEASQITSDILAKSPYNLIANRILVTILPETSRAESTQVYRHRLTALDPYTAFVKNSVWETAAVPDAAVTIEKLEWQPGDTVFENNGAWTGASIQKDDVNGEEPNWLKRAEAKTNTNFSSVAEPEPTVQPEDPIPDFMRAAGWGVSDGTAEEPVSFFDSPAPEEESTDDDSPIAQAELPDWMKNIAPAQAELEADDEDSNDKGDVMADDDFINDLFGDDDEKDADPLGDLGDLGTSNAEQDAALNWLEQLAANQGANPEELITDPNARTDAAPDWVQQAARGASPAPEPPTQPLAEAATPAADLPDWLNELGNSDSEPPATPANDAPDWLSELGNATEEAPATPAANEDIPDWLTEAAPASSQASEPATENDEMAWLSELREESDAPQTAPPPLVAPETPAPAPAPQDAIMDDTIGTLGTSSAEQDAALNWLEQLAAKQGANPDELITDPNARTEAAPEWVQQAQDVSEVAPQPAAEATPPQPVEEAPAATNDSMDWLNELSESSPEPESAAIPVDDIPAWLQEPVAEEPAPLATTPAEEIPAQAPVDEAPAAPSVANAVVDDTIGTLGTSSAEQDAALNWLEQLAAKQGANPDELITDPNARTEAAPEWVQQAQDVSETAPQLPVESTPAATNDDLDWINELSESSPEPESAAIPADDIPAWLQEPVAEESAPLATTPAEEIPAQAPVDEAPAAPSAANAVVDDTIGTLGTSSAEQDAALNWLEQLAAKQGANPDELITDPNARTEAAPEWVQQAQDVSETTSQPAVEAAPASEAPAAVPSVEKPQAEAPAEKTAVTPTPSADDDVPAWLRDDDDMEDMSTWESAVEETPAETLPAEVAEEQLLAEKAEERLAYEAPSAEPTPPTPPTPAEPVAPVEAPVPAVSGETPDWLQEMAKEEQQAEPTSEPQAIPPAQATEDLPDWLSGAAQESAPPIQENAPHQETEKKPDFSDWLEEDKPKLEKVPEASAEKKHDFSKWLEEDKKQVAPTKKDDWQPTAKKKPAKPEPAPEPPVKLPPRRKVQRMNTTMLRDITLMSAQAAMREGNISAALAEYGKLIKKKRLLDETIYDLREALYDYPIDISIWQMLGDAYMRAGQLQEAINAYTKAEELLR